MAIMPDKLYFERYNLLLEDGKTTTINLPKNLDLERLLERRVFLHDIFTDKKTRTDSIIRYKYMFEIEVTAEN